MDLLDRIREETRDPAQAGRLGALEPERGQAPPLLLAGMPSSGDAPGLKASGAAASTGRDDLAELEARQRGGEMALERAPPLLGIGDRAPDDDPVGAALLD